MFRQGIVKILSSAPFHDDLMNTQTRKGYLSRMLFGTHVIKASFRALLERRPRNERRLPSHRPAASLPLFELCIFGLMKLV